MKWLSSISSRLLRRKIFDPVEEGSTKLGKYYMSITLKSKKNEFYFIIYIKSHYYGLWKKPFYAWFT